MKKSFVFAATALCLALLPTVAQSQSLHAMALANFQRPFNGSLDQQAFFPELGQYLNDHLEYPELARKYGVEGVVTASALLSETGEVLSVDIREGLGLGCDEAVIQLICHMPAWMPSIKNGLPVKQRVTIPVRFRLQ